MFADTLDGTVAHYRDSDDLEVDAVVTASDGRWAAFEMKLGQADIASRVPPPGASRATIGGLCGGGQAATPP